MSGQYPTINDVKSFLESHPHVQVLHIKQDGSYYLNAFEGKDGKLYSRLDDYTKVGTESDLIVISVDRESVLSAPDSEKMDDKNPADGSLDANPDLTGGSAEPIVKLPEHPSEPVDKLPVPPPSEPVDKSPEPSSEPITPAANGTDSIEVVDNPEEPGKDPGADS